MIVRGSASRFRQQSSTLVEAHRWDPNVSKARSPPDSHRTTVCIRCFHLITKRKPCIQVQGQWLFRSEMKPAIAAATNARFAAFHGLQVVPVPLSTTPVPLRKIARSSRATFVQLAA